MSQVERPTPVDIGGSTGDVSAAGGNKEEHNDATLTRRVDPQQQQLGRNATVSKKLEPRVANLSPLAAQVLTRSAPSSPTEQRKSYRNLSGLSGAGTSPATDAPSRSMSTVAGGEETQLRDSSREGSMDSNPQLSNQVSRQNSMASEHGRESGGGSAFNNTRFTPAPKQASAMGSTAHDSGSGSGSANGSGANSARGSQNLLGSTWGLSNSSGNIFDQRYVKEAEQMLPRTVTSKQTTLRDKWSIVKHRRMAMLEAIIYHMTDPVQGIQQKKKHFNLARYTTAYSGGDVFDWLVANCKFLIRDEVMRFGQDLMDYGYLLSAEYGEKFEATGHMYIVQLPSLWPTRTTDPSDFDYAVYLLKRGLRNNVKDILKFYEEERLDALHKSLATVWADIESKVNEDTKMERNMKSGDRRMFRVQEAAFWRIHKPANGVVVRVFADESKDAEHKTDRYTETEFCDALIPSEQLAYLEKKLDQLQLSLVQNRKKVSDAAKNISQRCLLFKAVDPLLNDKDNPWILEDANLWNDTRTEPRRKEVRIWCYSLRDLLQDPLGVKFFDEFLAKEFSQENLHFYMRCKNLDLIHSKTEYLREAKAIYTQFIKVGSPNELNINSNTRAAITTIFEPRDGSVLSMIPPHTFTDASDHIFALMSKDSYARFCNSEVIQNMLAKKKTT
ncbi:hypothetical protein HK105_203798 [Polyrhizophydium stewartii]|uniref:Uncharacterized protein n=1 Tax=Polyrhizophydium stewartii TaxID=2732419 RepID=A0ABR4NB65_9FUNG|nr:Regulator of G-protein signaling 7 [Polyrhizophydium stewartii]